MTAYSIDGSRSGIVVSARSSIHDTKTRWDRLSGIIEADAKTLSASGASARITADMTKFDAGDWLKNRKLRKDLDVETHPSAVFSLTALTDVVREDDGTFRAVARGSISWRGREAAIEARGSGVVNDDRVEAKATFELDVTTLGVKPPKILMFKVEEVVSVEVTLVATASSSD